MDGWSISNGVRIIHHGGAWEGAFYGWDEEVKGVRKTWMSQMQMQMQIVMLMDRD